MKKDIFWLDDGWTVIQDADASKHILEVTVLAENGNIVEMRKRHNDGEETASVKGEVGEGLSLPISIKDFEKALKKDKINLK